LTGGAAWAAAGAVAAAFVTKQAAAASICTTELDFADIAPNTQFGNEPPPARLPRAGETTGYFW
jgi:methyl coenzyme M reductase beta subunit